MSFFTKYISLLRLFTEGKNITVLRMYNGLYMTSLDMAGFQISILNVTDNIHWIEHLDSPTQAPAWTGTVHSRFLTNPDDAIKLHVEDDSESITKVLSSIVYDFT